MIARASTALFVLLATRTAYAESASEEAGCSPVAPVLAAKLPANVPGIPFTNATNATNVTLTGPDGVLAETRLDEAWVLRITKALSPDTTYTLTWNNDCLGEMRSQTFVTTGLEPLPTTAGTIDGGDAFGIDASPPCDPLGHPIGTLTRAIVLHDAPALEPFLPVARVQLWVDDDVPADANYWQIGEYRPWSASAGAISARCPGGSTTHRVQVRVDIAGGPSVLSNEMVLELMCPDHPVVACRSATMPMEATPDSGCGFGPRGEPSCVGILGVLCVSACAANRRRTRARWR